MSTNEYIYLDPEQEKMPWEELEKIWVEKGRWTLKRLYDNLPFYKERCDKAGVKPEDLKSVEDYKKFPFLDKKDFLDAYPHKMLCVPYEECVRMHATSGTTGNRPTTGFYTKNDLATWQHLCGRNLAMIGLTSKDVFQNTTSAGLFTGGFGYAQGATEIGAMLIPFGPGKTAKQLQFFQDFKVTAFHAIPSFALRLAEVMEQEGISKDQLHLKCAILGAEGWSENSRKIIEERLGIKAYDNYGLTELGGPGVACECPEQNGLHIWSDYFYPEIIDPKTGEVLPEGETGELVLTSLWKEAMPVFRYRTGDITSIRKSKCACGRTGYIMDRIKGRKDDMHVIKGVNIYPTMIEHEVYKMPEYFTDIYLIIFHTVGVMDQITLHVEVKDGVDKGKAKKELEKNLLEATMLKINVVCFDPGTLPRQEGKAVRYQDIRDMPEGYRGWLKMMEKQNK